MAQKMFYVADDLASGKEAGGPLRAVNEWNFEQLAPFDYSASSEAAAGLTFAPPDNDAAVGRLARPKVGGFEVCCPLKKWGLRTTMQNKHIDEDTPLFEYGGELLEDDDKPVAKDDYIFTFEYQNRHFLLDACRRGNLARFVNHSCMPNCYTQLALLQATTATTGDAGHDVPCGQDAMVPHLMICASRKILAGEELTLDYGGAWWDAKRASEDLHCNCNTAKCRYKKTPIGEAS